MPEHQGGLERRSPPGANAFTFFGSSCSGAGPRIMRLGTGRLYNSASLDSIALVALKQVRERSEKFA
ncbi:MAG: hypothetical protein DME88_14150 [Verrucomicrobia bacterium]|nr:MAG: hypothetical protein DME88_14150 [Verrucomicrobiota bacterium]